jgi:hypothetical protein
MLATTILPLPDSFLHEHWRVLLIWTEAVSRKQLIASEEELNTEKQSVSSPNEPVIPLAQVGNVAKKTKSV